MMLIVLQLLNYRMRDDMGQDREIRSLLLNRLVRWMIFVLNRQGKGFWGLGGTSLLKFPLNAPAECIAKEEQQF